MDEPLRIAYVTPFGDDYRSITAHTSRRIDEWGSRGCLVQRFILGAGGRIERGAIANLRADISCVPAMVSSVKEFDPDVIYARWLAPVPGLYRRLAELAPLVLDIHADDLREVGGRSVLRQAYLRLFRGRELSQATAATFVVSELSTCSSYARIAGERAVFPNGSWLEARDPLIDTGAKPRVGMSTAGVNAWTGLDRFRQLAESLQDAADWVVVTPSAEAEAVKAVVGPSVEVVGTATQDEYVDQMVGWTVAVGTLALERKGLKSAAPLKVRDYVGMGIPTVLPYWDEGLADVEDEFLLKLVGPSESPTSLIDGRILETFINRAIGNNLDTRVSMAGSGRSVEAGRVRFLRIMSKA